jgi:hypothetical protein
MSGHTKWADIKHKGTPEALARARAELQSATMECSVTPVAHIDIDPNDDRIDVLLDALIADDRALGAYGLATGQATEGTRVSTTFQVAVPWDGALEHAVTAAALILNDALEAAGIDARCDGCSVVEGSDQFLLP